MRRLLRLSLFPVLVLIPPAFADDAPAAHARGSWQQHFARANTAGDGHLTLEEAKGGYPTVAKHFSSIDVDGKGYVTENDIRAWHALRRATANRTGQASDDELRPRNAFQRLYPEQRPVTSTSAQVSVATEPPSSGQ
jgi:hypothetical protein